MQISYFNNVSKNMSNINLLKLMTRVYMPLLNTPDVPCHNHLLHDAYIFPICLVAIGIYKQ